MMTVMHDVTERNFIWIGGTTIDWMTPEINSFQYAIATKTSNTKGYGSYLILHG